MQVGTFGTTSVGATVSVPNQIIINGITYFLGTGQQDIGVTTDQGNGNSTAVIPNNYDASQGYEPVWYDRVSLQLGSASTVTIPYGGTFTPSNLQTLTGTNGLSGLYDLSQSTIAINNPVNTHQAGTYTVTYTATIVGGASGQKVTVSTQQTVIVSAPVPSTVTLHFIDALTNQVIQAPQVLNGYQTDSYTLSTPTISGYRLDAKTSTSLSGTYQVSNQDLNLYYDKQTQVTINMVDSSTSKLLQTVTLTGYAGDGYNYALPNLQGYQSPPNATVSGLYTDINQTVTVKYVRPTGILTINYVNTQTGKAILPSEQFTNTIGDWSVIHIPNITGYDSLNTGVEVAFHQLLPNQTRTLYYDPNLDTVKVDFVDQNGHTLAPSQTITGYYGSSRTIKAQPINGYQISSGNLSSYTVSFNQLYQHIIFKYQPIKESITFRFINDAGQPVYKTTTVTGYYGDFYSYTPKVPWYDSLSYASQKKIVGKYNQPKTDIVVHYTRRQSQIDLYFVDDRGKFLGHQIQTSFEGLSYHFNLPHYPYLELVNSKLQNFTGTYTVPRVAIVIQYKHIPAYLNINLNVGGVNQNTTTFDGYWGDYYYYPFSPLALPYLTPYPGYNHVSGQFSNIWNTVNLNYNYVTTSVTLNLYGTDGHYLTSYTEYGHYGQNWSFNLPAWIGDYQLAMNSYESGSFGLSNQSYTIYYTKVVRVAVKAPQAPTLATAPKVGTMPWYVKEGMLEYGNNASTMKQYEEYAYAGNPALEAKVAAEYHDYGPMSVGNSSIAKQIQQYRKTTQTAVQQYEKQLKSEATKSKNSNNLWKSLGLTTLMSLITLGLTKLGNIGGGAAGDNIWTAGLGLLVAAAKGDLKKDPTGTVGQLTADAGISWATGAVTSAITDAGIGGAVGGPIGLAVGFGIGVIFDTAVSNSGNTYTIYDEQLVSGLDRSGTSAEDFGGN